MKTVEDKLKECAIGDRVEWQAFETECAVPRNGLYQTVGAAVRRVRALGFHFITRKGIGVERLADAGVVQEVLPSHARRLQVRGRRLREAAELLDFSKLDDEQRLSAIAHGTLGALVEQSARPARVKQLGLEKVDVLAAAKASITGKI